MYQGWLLNCSKYSTVIGEMMREDVVMRKGQEISELSSQVFYLEEREDRVSFCSFGCP
jgi:hypothetical protein